MVRQRNSALAAGLVALLMLAGCSGGTALPGHAAPGGVSPGGSGLVSGGPGPGSGSPAAASSADPGASPTGPAAAPQPALRCGGPRDRARSVELRASDGTGLAGALVGTGRRGVVLVPELGRRNMCGWWDYAAYLAGRGFQVLIFDHRCVGYSQCPVGGGPADGLIDDVRAAVRQVRAAGARSVVLVGASQGGSEVLIAAAGRPVGVTAVAALSPDELDTRLAAPPVATASQAAPAVRVPVLYAVAPGDPYVSVDQVRTLYTVTGSRDKHLSVLTDRPGEHGWDLVAEKADGRPAFSGTLVTFLTKHSIS